MFKSTFSGKFSCNLNANPLQHSTLFLKRKQGCNNTPFRTGVYAFPGSRKLRGVCPQIKLQLPASISPPSQSIVMILQQYYFSINNISKNQSSSIKMLPTDNRQNAKIKKNKNTCKPECNYPKLISYKNCIEQKRFVSNRN